MVFDSPLGDIEKLEKDLWEAADQLRANSKLTSSEYCMPVLGVIFLRHAQSRRGPAQGRRLLPPADRLAPEPLPGRRTGARARAGQGGGRQGDRAADWSLTPGRYVGVAPPETDGDFDFEQAMRDIHVELASLNDEAAALAKRIQENFEEIL
jgi:hypothetical protein